MVVDLPYGIVDRLHRDRHGGAGGFCYEAERKVIMSDPVIHLWMTGESKDDKRDTRCSL